MGERRVRNAKVVGSSPIASIFFSGKELRRGARSPPEGTRAQRGPPEGTCAGRAFSPVGSRQLPSCIVRTFGSPAGALSSPHGLCLPVGSLSGELLVLGLPWPSAFSGTEKPFPAGASLGLRSVAGGLASRDAPLAARRKSSLLMSRLGSSLHSP